MVSVLKLRCFLLKRDFKMFLLMIGLSLVFTYVFGISSGGVSKVTVGLALEDDSEVQELLYEGLLENYSTIYSGFEKKELLQAVDDERLLIGVEIEKAKITIYKKSDSVEVVQQEIALKGHVRDLLREHELIQGIMPYVGDYDEAKLSFRKEKLYDESFKMNLKPFGAPKQGKRDELLKGILGFTLYFSTFSMVFGMGDIVEDKRLYTWHRLLTTPMGVRDILAGNVIFYSVLGICQISLVFLIGKWMFQVNYGGQLLLVLLISAAYVLAMNGLGLFIASVVKDAHQLSAVTPIILTAMAMLGGCMWSLDLVKSKVLLTISYFTPHRWALTAIEEVVGSGSFGSTGIYTIGVLLLMSFIFLSLGSLKIIRRPI